MLMDSQIALKNEQESIQQRIIITDRKIEIKHNTKQLKYLRIRVNNYLNI